MIDPSNVQAEAARLVGLVAHERDREAFAVLFDYYAPRLASYLQRHGADATLAEEVAQDSMLALWRKADQFDPARSSVGTWLHRIARNRRIDLIRRAHGGALELDESIQQVDEAPLPDEALGARQRASFVAKAMASLPPEQFSLVRLAFFEGHSHSEIADQTGLPLGTVKSRIRLAFSRLKRSLEADGLVEA